MVQVFISGLLWLGGESGWCFVSKSIGDWLYANGNMGVGS